MIAERTHVPGFLEMLSKGGGGEAYEVSQESSEVRQRVQ
jgi:hypothetical protein